MPPDQFADLVRGLAGLNKETEWAEWKRNNADPGRIGRTLSAVSNGAAIAGKPSGYMLWGVDDKTGEIVGTTLDPYARKVGNEDLLPWLCRELTPRHDIKVHAGKVGDRPVVLMVVDAARGRPTEFKGEAYVRVQSQVRVLKEYGGKERALWRVLDASAFETDPAAEAVTSDFVLEKLDYPEYFLRTGQPLPDNRAAIMERLSTERLIVSRPDGRYDLTNLGAVLFARRLTDFRGVARKAPRLIFYDGDDRGRTKREKLIDRGYAAGFEDAVDFLNSQLPENEEVAQALRAAVRLYPEIAVRELLANTLIHQDFSVRGAGPSVEVFGDRIEFTNPGAPLIEPLRFIDQPPRSRNEDLAGFLRRINICEERGSGVDKVIIAVEFHQLPPPDFRQSGDNTVAVLYAPRTFSEMDREERVRACYQHAVLMWVSGKRMTNATLRTRLGIADANYPQASKIIRDAIGEELVKLHSGGSQSSKDRSYLPFWA